MTEQPCTMSIFGRPANVVIEVDMGKDRTLRVPIGDLSRFTPASPASAPYGELTILVHEPLIRRLHEARRETQRLVGP